MMSSSMQHLQPIQEQMPENLPCPALGKALRHVQEEDGFWRGTAVQLEEQV